MVNIEDMSRELLKIILDKGCSSYSSATLSTSLCCEPEEEVRKAWNYLMNEKKVIRYVSGTEHMHADFRTCEVNV